MADTTRKNISIHPNPRKPGTAARRARNHARNKQLRSELYSECQGGNDWQKAGKWNTTLFALSNGTAG